MQLYTFKEASEKLNCNIKQLYHYQAKNLIQTITQKGHHNRNIKHISEAELIRIQKALTPPPHSDTAYNFAIDNHLSASYVRNLIQSLQLKPSYQPNEHTIGPNQTYYDNQALNQIHQYLKNKKTKTKYLNIQSNTNRIYQPHLDYTISQLAKLLNPNQPLSNHVIANWINQNKIPYRVDQNGKLYFTKNQIETIKNQYKKMPDHIFGNTTDLAKYLKIDLSELAQFKNAYQIPTTTVLGYKDVFYTMEQAINFIMLYQHPELRPHQRHTKNQIKLEQRFWQYFKKLNHHEQLKIFNQISKRS